ncbi:MAG: hypothetical protein QG635_795 [Bacteroidota bacterium]|nr:hypothetical protein [Bacteroidota bacterium]
MEKRLFYILFSLLLIIPLTGFQSEQSEIEQKIMFHAQKFKYLLETAYKNYIDTVDIDKISDAAYKAMLNELDPFSVYNPPEKQKQVDNRSKGSSEGIGIEIAVLNDTAYIYSVIEGSPADSAGIKTGDKALFIDGSNIAGMSKNEIMNKIAGQSGTALSLIVRRGNTSSLQEYRIMRQKVEIKSLDAAFVIPETNIAYIKYNRFSEISHKEFDEVKKKLKKEGAKSVILDFRGNPGGYLEEIVKIADEFIPEGYKITYTKARNKEFLVDYNSTPGGGFESAPVVLLLDNQSSSGSEMIAGALQDIDRGLVVGEPSFGKGVAQSQWKLADGSGFRLTVASYYTPSGRCIQKLQTNEKPLFDPSFYLNLNSSTQKMVEDMLAKNGNMTQLPIYKSSKGRNLIGGGGIFPDYFVKNDTLTLLTKVLEQKGFILEYIYDYLSSARGQIERKYKADFLKFSSNFDVNDEMLESLRRLSYQKNTWNDAMYIQDKEYIRALIKAGIANALWGSSGYYSVMLINDKQVQKAIEVMHEAGEMLR